MGVTMVVLSLMFPLQNFGGGPGIPTSSNWFNDFFLSLNNIRKIKLRFCNVGGEALTV